MKRFNLLLVLLAILAHSSADALTIDTVPVANPGNAPELSGIGAGGEGPNRFCGFVDYAYHIGTFEITAGQYTEFLNAIAAADTYGLYNPAMWTEQLGCRVQRTGSSGTYAYSVAPDWTDRPVNLVSWADAARFCNWLHNGQPTGAQDLTTTEDGPYRLDGATSGSALMAFSRRPGATWVLPTEDEWYKAAYHENDGVTGNYHVYPTASDVVPDNVLRTPDPGNSSNFVVSNYAVGDPYYRTTAGAFTNSASAYGTFDQGGNVWEWNEASVSGSDRGLRGGSFSSLANRLHAGTRSFGAPVQESVGFGFRVARLNTGDLVPAASDWGIRILALLVMTAGTLPLRQDRRRHPSLDGRSTQG